MFNKTKKILKGLGATALGVGAIVSAAAVFYGAANATISAEATKVANMTAGNKQVTMQIVKENSPLAVKYSNLINPVMNKVFGANENITAVDSFINDACDKAFDKFKEGAIQYEANSKVSKSNSSSSLEVYVNENIKEMRRFTKEFFDDKDLVDYVEANTNKDDLAKSFIKEYKNNKTDNLKTLENGLNEGKILSYSNFKDKMTQQHSGEILKEKYQEYLQNQMKNMSKEKSISPSFDHDNSKQMSL